MKVTELENQLWFGDVIIQCIDTNIITGKPMKRKGYVEFIVTWVRNENQDGLRDTNDPNDFDAILMDNNGEIIHIRDIKSLDNWEYSHCAFKFGASREGDENVEV
jgi:hypothetical protein